MCSFEFAKLIGHAHTIVVWLELRWMTFEQASRGEEIHLRGHPFIVSFVVIKSTQHDVKRSNAVVEYLDDGM